MIKMKQCIIYDRECIDCKECLMCDLDSSKVCDNCEKCLHLDDKEYNGIIIDEIIAKEKK